MEAAAVSLPDPDGPRPVDMLNLLPDDLKHTYATAAGGALEQNEPIEQSLPPSYDNIEDTEYRKLIVRMHKAGMLCFLLTVKVVVGLFAVPKGEHEQRLIVDGRRANSYFVTPAGVELPGPEHLAALRVRPAQYRQQTAAADNDDGSAGLALLAGSKLDVRDCFHRLRVPEWISTYFGLRPLKLGELCFLLGVKSAQDLGIPESTPADTLIYPACATVPMGFSHSCVLVQAIMTKLACRAGFDVARDFVGANQECDFVVGRAKICGFYDDWVMLSLTDAASVASLRERHAKLRLLWAQAGLHHKPSKEVQPQVGGKLEALGLEFDFDDATLEVAPARRAELVRLALGMAKASRPPLHDMLSLLGHWIWSLRVCRPAMVVLRSTFAWTAAATRAAYKFQELAKKQRGARGRRARDQQHRPLSLWKSVRKELRALAALNEELFADLTAPVLHRVLATDASGNGGGAVDTEINFDLEPDLLRALDKMVGKPPPPLSERSTWLPDGLLGRKWTTRDVYRWPADVAASETINELEARELVRGVRRIAARLARRRARHVRLFVLVDNSVLVAGVRKGRSSSWRMLRRLRPLSAVLLRLGIRLLPIWSPTATHPADDASRVYNSPDPRPRARVYAEGRRPSRRHGHDRGAARPLGRASTATGLAGPRGTHRAEADRSSAATRPTLALARYPARAESRARPTSTPRYPRGRYQQGP